MSNSHSYTVVTVASSHSLDVLERIEMKGLRLCGLKTSKGVTYMVLPDSLSVRNFAASLQNAMVSLAGLTMSIFFSLDERVLKEQFSQDEIIESHQLKAGVVSQNTKADKGGRTAKFEHGPAVSKESPVTHHALIGLLDQYGVDYGSSTHAAVRTSEEAAQIRGATLESGAKAMLLNVKPSNEFVLAVISAAAKMDSKLLKKAVSPWFRRTPPCRPALSRISQNGIFFVRTFF